MVIYNIKNSKELASYINYTNLNNMITEEEMKEFLEKAKALDCDNVAAFTHAGFLRQLISIVLDANVSKMNFVCSNCCIVILELRNGNWMLSGIINPQ